MINKTHFPTSIVNKINNKIASGSQLFITGGHFRMAMTLKQCFLPDGYQYLVREMIWQCIYSYYISLVTVQVPLSWCLQPNSTHNSHAFYPNGIDVEVMQR